VAVTIIKELAKQTEHHVTHDACFLEALHARCHPTSYHQQWRFLYPKNALLTLPVFPNTPTNHPCQVDPRNHSSGSGPTCQPPRTKTTGSCPRTRKHPRPCSTGGPHREQKLILRKSMLAPMLNKNLSRPGRRFHPPSPQPPGELAPMCRRESFRAI